MMDQLKRRFFQGLMNGPFSMTVECPDDADYQGPGPDPELEPDQRAQRIVDALSLDEVISCLGGYKSMAFPAIPKAGLPSIWFTDATSGPRIFGPCTSMPSPLNLAASWNPALAGNYGRTVGEETRTRGAYVILGPGVNIYRNPTGGRNFEYMGEDPLLAGILAEEYIKAAQKAGAICTIKHFAANNSDYDRHRASSDVDPRTLREIYLPAFERAVRRAKVGSVMTAYNPVNGIFASAHRELITEILREEWGFDGFVMSDWLSLYDTAGPVQAGLDLEMPKADWFSRERILQALEAGEIREEQLRTMVCRVLTVFFRMGAYDNPVIPREPIPIGDPDHREAALAIALEGIVLLKNGDSTAIATPASGVDDSPAGPQTTPRELPPLPLTPPEDRTMRIMLAGPFQEKFPRGGGGSCLVRSPAHTQVFASELAKDLGSGAEILSWDHQRSFMKELGPEDTVIFLGGFDEDRQSEAYDRDWQLPKDQLLVLGKLMNRRASQGFKLGVVLFTGGGVETRSWLHQVDWLVWAGYPGQEGPEALSRLLSRRDTFSGKLPFTMISRWDDLPSNHYYVDNPGSIALRRVFLDQGKVTKRQPWSMPYKEGQMVGYRAFAGWNTSAGSEPLPLDAADATPAFPFGFGLSYTTVELGDVQIKQRPDVDNPDEDRWDAQVTLTNTGDLPGKPTLQLYLEDPESSLPRPARSLLAFKKITLPALGSRTVPLSWSLRDLAFYWPEKAAWVAEAGVYRIHGGFSSGETRLVGEIHLDETRLWSYKEGKPEARE
ncbi:beta-glucosidase [Spirochaeta lutea]|nr:glycoside hydrolase family 3 N-terminal domain-containing protein [Spirochaeta lutea]